MKTGNKQGKRIEIGTRT